MKVGSSAQKVFNRASHARIDLQCVLHRHKLTRNKLPQIVCPLASLERERYEQATRDTFPFGTKIAREVCRGRRFARKDLAQSVFDHHAMGNRLFSGSRSNLQETTLPLSMLVLRHGNGFADHHLPAVTASTASL